MLGHNVQADCVGEEENERGVHSAGRPGHGR
jgi:hypothetical protein